jgi:hypothetical protein
MVEGPSYRANPKTLNSREEGKAMKSEELKKDLKLEVEELEEKIAPLAFSIGGGVCHQ